MCNKRQGGWYASSATERKESLLTEYIVIGYQLLDNQD